MKKTLTGIGLFSFFFSLTALAQAPLEPTMEDPYIEEELFIDDFGEEGGYIEEAYEPAPDPYMNQGGTVGSVETTYSVVNVSQNNANAQSSGVREGDVLRYEFTIKSDTEDVVNFVTSLDISQILQNAEIIDAGLGNVNGGTIVFPSFTQQAPCEKVFSFFVRLNKCTPQTRIVSSGHGEQTTVMMTCELAQVGPGSQIMWYMTIALLIGFALIGIFNRRTHKS